MEDLKKELSTQDSIFRPDIIKLSQKYTSGDKKVMELIEILSNSFQGYPLMVEVLGDLLNSLGEDVSKTVRDNAANTFLQMIKNNPRELESVILNSPEPPEWVQTLTHDDMWVKPIIQLINEFPNNIFLQYCTRQISYRKPDVITTIPPGCITPHHFITLLQMNVNKQKRLIDLICSNDATVVMGAQWAFALNNQAFVNKLIEGLPDSRRPLFMKTYLKYYQIPEFLEDFIIQKRTKVTKEFVKDVLHFMNESTNQQTKKFVAEHLNGLIFNPAVGNDGSKLLIQLLIKVCVPNGVDTEMRHLTEKAAQKVMVNSYNIDSRGYILHAVANIRFFAAALLVHLQKRLEKREKMTLVGNILSELDIVYEIAYHYPDMVSTVLSLTKNILSSITSSGDEYKESTDKILHFAIKIFFLGYPIEILEMVGTNRRGLDRNLGRRFIDATILSLEPPFSPQFVDAITRFFESNTIQDLYPDSMNPHNVRQNEIAHFSKFYNWNESTKIHSKVLEKLSAKLEPFLKIK